MSTPTRRAFMQGSLGALALGALAACSNGSTGTGSSSSSAKADSFTGTGPISWVQGKDFSGGMVQKHLDEWNKQYPNEKVTLIELSSEADQQRQSLINNAQTNSAAYDVIGLDVVWVAEFAANRWVVELPADQFTDSDYIKGVMDTGLYRDKRYAMPYATDASIMYYRKDILAKAGIKDVPATWDDVLKAIEAVRKLPGMSSIGGFGGQWAKYEGLTCNISEFIHTFGGDIVDSSGKVIIDSPETVKAVQHVIDAFKNNVIPKAALEWKEEDGRNAFEAGKVLFYRQWPYQYSNDLKQLGTDKFGVAPLPSINGKKYQATLGGHNCGITTNCKNKATALKFVKWWTNKESEQYALSTQSNAPTMGSLYTGADNVKKFPYLPTLKASLDEAKGRPRVVNYGDVTAAIQDAIYPAIQSGGDAQSVVTKLSDTLKSIIK
ncbi:ABC transporter substrate-binding protein [Acidipropionibacterium timonense]|uniref:ABC transporter substrate-binding protein n=1 Tax=Acidipropionibacterium timonense TaxID=2161818 RepID=UPI00102F500A|nr:ABC transporter substrate-binding protein [Acidipropionibacterium timonense]